MLPLWKLLSRIRWDKEFGRGHFELGYHDRVAGNMVRVPFSQVLFESGNRHSFRMLDQDGLMRTIPYHRVREVYRNGELIWQRPA